MDTRTLRQSSSIRLFLLFLIHHLERCGVSESALRGGLRLSEGWLESLRHEELVSLTPRLVGVAQQLANDELLCLHAGEHFHFCLAGAGGLAATHAPTPALALETFGRFVSGDGILTVVPTSTPEETILSVKVVAPWPKAACEQVLDGFFSSLVAALRAVCGPSCNPLQIRLSRAEPDNAKSFARVFRGKVAFRCGRDEITFQTEELTQTSLLYEPLLYEQLLFITDLGTDKPAGTSPFRQLAEQAIRAGNHSIESVAETLQVNRRTLQRRLQKEGTTFRTVLNEGRVGLAKSLLLDSTLTVTEIAKRLNYSDDKSFRKAFKTITGKTPSETRDAGK